MDAIEFIKERARMCAAYSDCNECPIQNHDCFASWHVDIEQMVDTVEKWSKEHPIMTNRMKFEEVFGCDMSDIPGPSSNGWVSINSITLPNFIFTKDWWNAEYKEKKHDALTKKYLNYPTGKWEQVPYKRQGHEEVVADGYSWRCSNCGDARKRNQPDMRFCPNCGARMEEE